MGSILLKTAIPGPRSRALFERRNNAVPRGISHATAADNTVYHDAKYPSQVVLPIVPKRSTATAAQGQ
jgi:hypothetical protein